MSHANGQIKFKDGTILYYEYNGTCAVVCNCLYENKETIQENWRQQPHNECTCEKDESVEIGTDYANGFYWDGRACKSCKAITDGFGTGGDNKCYETECDGLPSWWVRNT